MNKVSVSWSPALKQSVRENAAKQAELHPVKKEALTPWF